MVVIVEMARNARSIHVISEVIFAMTVVASQITVTTLKLEFCIPVVIKARIIPVGRAMAIATFISASAVMSIVFLVAGKTVCRSAEIGRIFMTVQTSSFEMMADQRIVGHIVIEFGILPTRCIVAVCAVRPQALLVHIIFLMAIDADSRCVAVLQLRLVTVLAGCLGMLALQRKIG